mmetsp:Transcript_45016/g.119341  ORF Transcript_45016/g.119341 Transcript_45016/m.119341 type:complete len:399 (+) Transcript_45016:796-1992(+)
MQVLRRLDGHTRSAVDLACHPVGPSRTTEARLCQGHRPEMHRPILLLPLSVLGREYERHGRRGRRVAVPQEPRTNRRVELVHFLQPAWRADVLLHRRGPIPEGGLHTGHVQSTTTQPTHYKLLVVRHGDLVRGAAHALHVPVHWLGRLLRSIVPRLRCPNWRRRQRRDVSQHPICRRGDAAIGASLRPLCWRLCTTISSSLGHIPRGSLAFVPPLLNGPSTSWRRPVPCSSCLLRGGGIRFGGPFLRCCRRLWDCRSATSHAWRGGLEVAQGRRLHHSFWSSLRRGFWCGFGRHSGLRDPTCCRSAWRPAPCEQGSGFGNELPTILVHVLEGLPCRLRGGIAHPLHQEVLVAVLVPPVTEDVLDLEFPLPRLHLRASIVHGGHTTGRQGRVEQSAPVA